MESDSGWQPSDRFPGGYVRTRVGLKFVGGAHVYESTSEIMVPLLPATPASQIGDHHAALQEELRIVGRNERDARNEEDGAKKK